MQDNFYPFNFEGIQKKNAGKKVEKILYER